MISHVAIESIELVDGQMFFCGVPCVFFSVFEFLR